MNITTETPSNKDLKNPEPPRPSRFQLERNRDPFDYTHLIINAPKLQSLKQRFSYSVITFAFWVFWFYLWQPIAAILAWVLGLKIFYENMITLGGIEGFFKLISSYIIAVCSMALFFFGWAYYNNLRFKEKTRRTRLWKVSALNLGELFNLKKEQVLHCKASRRLVVHFDAHGKIKDVTSGPFR